MNATNISSFGVLEGPHGEGQRVWTREFVEDLKELFRSHQSAMVICTVRLLIKYSDQIFISGSDKKTRNILPNGFYKFVVHNPKELEMLMMHNRF